MWELLGYPHVVRVDGFLVSTSEGVQVGLDSQHNNRQIFSRFDPNERNGEDFELDEQDELTGWEEIWKNWNQPREKGNWGRGGAARVRSMV